MNNLRNIPTWGIFSYYNKDGIFWFRIFGYGLWMTNAKTYDPPFSVRTGYAKVYYVGSKVFKFLYP